MMSCGSPCSFACGSLIACGAVGGGSLIACGAVGVGVGSKVAVGCALIACGSKVISCATRLVMIVSVALHIRLMDWYILRGGTKEPSLLLGDQPGNPA